MWRLMKVILAIQPSGQTVFYYPWAGDTQGGKYRDNIAELLLAANRTPASGEEPEWTKLVGAKIKVRLKDDEVDQNGVKRNTIGLVYTPKKVDTMKPTEKSFSQSEFLKARGKQIEASGGEPEPDNIPY